MEIREFAECILYSQKIEEKLFRPELFQDNSPGNGSKTPRFPGREEKIRFATTDSERTPFPSISRIREDSTRGQILHFFANHELLALELMALTLLKFPNAPKEFRKGIVHTMLEEQNHMEMYINRMQDFSVGFGEVSLSSFFWDSLKGIKSPLDYVVKMSMTFEQANIDFSKFYLDKFLQIEDKDTAEILKIIYEEEIGHVKYGFDWFKRWECPNENEEWQRYQYLLDFPLTPMRAKGMIYDREGRKRIGFSNEYIHKLSLYSQSKGRLPTVYYFNPNCEEELNSENFEFSPDKHAKILEKDLSLTLSLLSSKDDITILPELCSEELIAKWRELNLGLCEYIQCSNPQNGVPKPLKGRNLGAIQPWGWNRYVNRSFKSWQSKIKEGFREVNEVLFKKSFANQLAKEWHQCQVHPDYIEKDFLDSKPCKTKGEVVSAVEELLSQEKKAIIKLNFSTSGRKAFKVFNKEEITENLLQRIENLFLHNSVLLVEEYLNNMMDLSVILKISQKNKNNVKGVTRFQTMNNGQYCGHYINDFYGDVPKELMKAFNASKAPSDRLISYLSSTGEFIAEHLIRKYNYEGYLGIDALIYKRNDRFYLKPILEINPRITMGHVALQLNKKVVQGRKGKWEHLSLQKVKNLGFQSFKEFSEDLTKKFPLKIKEIQPGAPLIDSGVLLTNDPESAQLILSFLKITPMQTSEG